jgi:GT2 family glycosyltransferase
MTAQLARSTNLKRVLKMSGDAIKHKEAEPMLVSAVVPNYNGERLLGPCLESLRRQDLAGLEVIVVDDASTDHSREMVRRDFPEFRLLTQARNAGFCSACNAGAAAARGKYVALINSDTVLPSDGLSRLAACLDSRPVAWVAAPHINNLNLDMSRYPGRGTMSVTGIIIQNVFRQPGDIFGAPGAALLFRRTAVGLPFDPEYQFFHEDVYLSWRTWLAGQEVAACPEVVVDHLGSATVQAQPSRNRWLLERNRWLNALTFWSAGTLFRLWPLWLLVLPLEWLADVSAGRPLGPRLRAYLWLLAHPLRIRRKRRALQAQRRVPDREILKRMSCRVTNTDTRAARWANALARGWVRLVGLKTFDSDGSDLSDLSERSGKEL